MIEKASLEDLDDVYELICVLENKDINREHFNQVYKDGLNNKDVIFVFTHLQDSWKYLRNTVIR